MRVTYSTIRRIKINAPMSEREKVNNWLDKNNYYVKRSGPKLINASQVDVTKLFIIAEKRIK